MNTKTFEAIEKLKEIEIELHRLKNALEMANRALDAQRTWQGLTDEELREFDVDPIEAKLMIAKLRSKNENRN